jgi:hypothetical protein
MGIEVFNSLYNNYKNDQFMYLLIIYLICLEIEEFKILFVDFDFKNFDLYCCF